MCKTVKYWMKLYVARIVKGGLIAVVASFLFFQCSKEMDNVIISKNMLAFDDIASETGDVYTISLSEDPAAGKRVQIVLRSENDALQISPAVVNFTEITGKAPQTITVTRKAGAPDRILKDITGLINHTIASYVDSDPNITTFQDDSIVGVTVRSTVFDVIISENTLFSYDILGDTGVEYTISLNQDLALDRTVQITLTSENDALQISPRDVNFTAGESSQIITVTRTDDASDEISATITGLINHTITSNEDSDLIITFQGDSSTVGVTVWSTDSADPDGDGLIEIKDETMLNNMRYNLKGTSYKTSNDGNGDSSGCPDSGCNGYELIKDLDLLSLLDTNGNGEIDTTMVGIDTNDDDKQMTVIDTGMGKDTSWMPIGHDIFYVDSFPNSGKTTQFRGIFEGNHHTVENLWVNVAGRGGLFGVTSGTVEIRNVGVISGSIHSFLRSFPTANSGGLVGHSDGSLTIINSYFSGPGGVFSANTANGGAFICSGGLVGHSDGSLTIINSYFSGSGGIFSASSSSASPSSGGLVGYSDGSLTIINSYFGGSSQIFSFNSFLNAAIYSGGLVGESYRHSSLKIINSYFGGSGRISSFNSVFSNNSYSGGLVGRSSKAQVVIRNSYWNTESPQIVNGSLQSPKRAQNNVEINPSGVRGLTLVQLMGIDGNDDAYPSNLPSGVTDNTKSWNLGTDMQLPAIKRCMNPITVNGVTICTSYGALIAGQR